MQHTWPIIYILQAFYNCAHDGYKTLKELVNTRYFYFVHANNMRVI